MKGYSEYWNLIESGIPPAPSPAVDSKGGQ
jgi:hypothetical protein